MVNPEYEYENNIEFLALKKEATIEMKENKIAILSKIVEKEELGFKKESKKLAVLNSGVDIAGKSDDEIEAIELC